MLSTKNKSSKTGVEDRLDVELTKAKAKELDRSVDFASKQKVTCEALIT